MIEQIRQVLTKRESETGVPKRIALMGIFLLVTIFGISIRALTVLNASPTFIAMSGLFLATTAFAQATMFRGRRPRIASWAAGAIVFPLLCAGAAIFAIRPFDWRLSLSATVVGVFIGPPLGYLTGMFVAGWFYAFPTLFGASLATDDSLAPESPNRPDPSPTHPPHLPADRHDHRPNGDGDASPIPRREQSRLVAVKELPFLPYISPYYFRWWGQHPIRRASQVGVVFALLALMIVSLPIGLSIQATVSVLVIATVCGFFLSGLTYCRRSDWILSLSLFAAAGCIGHACVKSLCIVRHQPRLSEWVDGAFAGGPFVLALTTLSLAGWIHLTQTRGRHPRHKSRVGVILILIAFSATVVIMSWWIAQFRRSKLEQLATLVYDSGGRIFSVFTPGSLQIDAIECGTRDCQRQIQLAKESRHVRLILGYIYIPTQSDFTDDGGQVLDNMPLLGLSIEDPDVGNHLFDDIQSLQIQHIWIVANVFDDNGARQFARVCSHPKSTIRHFSLSNAHLSSAGLCDIIQAPRLWQLNISDKGDSKWNLATAKPTNTLVHLSLNSAQLDDDVAQEFPRLFPSLQTLNLSNNPQLTEVGIRHLAGCPKLKTLTIDAQTNEHQLQEFFSSKLPQLTLRTNPMD